MKNIVLKASVLAGVLVGLSVLVMVAVDRFDDEKPDKQEELKFDDDEIPDYKKSLDSVSQVKEELEKERAISILESHRLDAVAEEKRLKELARIEAEKKAKEEAERERVRQEKIAQQEKQKKLDEERDKRRAEKKKQAEQPVVSRGGGYEGNWRTFEATYYGADCYKCSGVTALGIDVRNTIYHNGMRVVAVDPNVIPLGSIVQVKTPNETFKAVAGDTGGRIKKMAIDILVESEAVSKKYGRHSVQVRILK